VRIIGGSLRGRCLQVPAGRDMRPTADRARQTLVQIFASLGAEDERVGHYRRLLAQALN